MASKLALLLVLAAAALAAAKPTINVTVSPSRQSLNTYDSHGALFDVHVNNWEQHIAGHEISCHAVYTYLDHFGQRWAHPVDLRINSCNSGRTDNCNTWYATVPAPEDSSKVIEAVAYCRHLTSKKVWAEGKGNIKFQYAD
eukprot:m51a1_g14581 hypothetical protein (141) ;mRNA; f:1118791-1119282